MWKKPFILRWWSLLAGVIALLIFFPSTLNAQAPADQVNRLPATNLVILVIENKVHVLRGGAQVWEAARTNQVLAPGDHIRTGPRSRAAVLLSNQTTVRLDEKSEFLIETPPEAAGAKARRLILNFV
ncbi:MAG TPA: hypothetical protein VGR78_18325, partial [Verrucomicrobiae bacterium]|nr:hypothetical protein [Verrucomicrobiae bacterium]